jgi:hypothetical protein
VRCPAVLKEKRKKKKKRKVRCFMKKALVIMMLVIAAPLYAVTGEAVDNADGTCTITIPGANAVAFALTVDSSAAITNVAIDSFFDVYMDSAYTQEAGTGYVYQTGTPIADPAGPGEVGLSDLFTISAGGLDDTGSEVPPADIVITLTGPDGTTGTVDTNALRGGMVDATGTEVVLDAAIPFSISVNSECFDSEHPDYAEWVAAGRPECWCYLYQCHGDADGAQEGDVKKGYFYVSYADIGILSANWKGTSGDTTASGDYPADVCADFDRSEEGDIKKGYFRVSYADIGILSANWKGTSGDTTASGDDPYAHTCGGDIAPTL